MVRGMAYRRVAFFLAVAALGSSAHAFSFRNLLAEPKDAEPKAADSDSEDSDSEDVPIEHVESAKAFQTAIESSNGTDLFEMFDEWADDELSEYEDDDEDHPAKHYAIVYRLLKTPLKDGKTALDGAYLVGSMSPEKHGKHVVIVDIRLPELSADEFEELEDKAEEMYPDEDNFEFTPAMQNLFAVMLDVMAERFSAGEDAESMDGDEIMKAIEEKAKNVDSGNAETEVFSVKAFEKGADEDDEPLDMMEDDDDNEEEEDEADEEDDEEASDEEDDEDASDADEEDDEEASGEEDDEEAPDADEEDDEEASDADEEDDEEASDEEDDEGASDADEEGDDEASDDDDADDEDEDEDEKEDADKTRRRRLQETIIVEGGGGGGGYGGGGYGRGGFGRGAVVCGKTGYGGLGTAAGLLTGGIPGAVLGAVAGNVLSPSVCV